MSRSKWEIFVLFILIAVPAVSAEVPQVLQLSDYSPPERAMVMQAITKLQTTLSDSTLGAQRGFSDGWQSQDFAAYTAGVLAGEGYEALLANGQGWPDGVHTWVLVKLALDGRTVWIPIEATPTSGDRQILLGKVPLMHDSTGNLQFDERYLSFLHVSVPSSDIPPVAVIHMPRMIAVVEENVRFLAIGSYDQDGEVVIYRWDFGDGDVMVSSTYSAEHMFRDVGVYTVTLTVFDNRGESNSTSIRIKINGPIERKPPHSCGCGG